MSCEMVLNELSLEPTADCIEEARRRMQQLVQTSARATSLGLNRVLRTFEDISSIELAPGYPVVKWRNDKAVDLEIRRLFRSFVTKSPFVEGLSTSELKVDSEITDFEFEGKKAGGLGFAYSADSLAMSFDSHDQWNKSVVEIVCIYVDDDLKILCKSVHATHASNVRHVEANISAINAWVQSKCVSGMDLWDRRMVTFPDLEFCDSVRDNLSSLVRSNPLTKLVLRKLIEIQNYSAVWQSGPFDPKALLNVSPESESTLSNPRLRNQREFLCPDGQTRLFEWHSKLSVNQWRIHFYPDTLRRRIIIGYVGPHLGTTLF